MDGKVEERRKDMEERAECGGKLRGKEWREKSQEEGKMKDRKRRKN